MLIRDLIHIPESDDQGKFVLKLTEGVTKPEETVETYVATDDLVGCFRDALNFIKGAVDLNTSKSAYLHGSFGSGKSHFMAILSLILRRDPAVGKLTKLASVIEEANSWNQGKKFLLVPYHMIGAKNMEAGILGGYAEFMARTHPKAPIPAVYLVDDLFKDACNLRDSMGDEKFFAGLNEGEADSDWGDVESEWDAEAFDRAVAAPPVPENDPNYAPSEPRRDLASALIKNYFQSYKNISQANSEAYVSLDAGLSIISQHAKAVGYDGVILFLDELVLWLAGHAVDLQFMHQEGQKLSKLVEAQHANRPIPVISFVARQRDLGELVGDSITGSQKLNFTEALKHWEGRFHRIPLEDRNLPAIAEARVLKPVSDKAKEQLQQSFDDVMRMRKEVKATLLTNKYDEEIFRKVYPFSPALVDTLVGVSSLLQRERTALKVMVLLLIQHRDHLKLGDIVPVGDLFDVIAHGDEAFNQDMAIQFNNAKRLYHQKLLPLLERKHGVRKPEVDELPWDDATAVGFRGDDRLIKTLLLAALVPGVESLKKLNAGRLAALNWGTIRTPVPGKEGGEVLRRLSEWAGEVGEIKIGEEQTNPTISIQLSGVDTERIIEQARHEDSPGNRQRLIRKVLFEEMGVQDDDEFFLTHEFEWRNTSRWCEIGFGNIRSLPSHELESGDSEWKLMIDFPFDEPGYGPQHDIAKLNEFTATHPEGSLTIAWLPSFLSQTASNELGMLVILEHILAGERFDGYAAILPFEDRHIAKSLLENQRSRLRQRMRQHLEAAYGIDRQTSDSVDTSHELHEHFMSLKEDFDPQPPAAPNLGDATQKLIDQALEYQFPAHPFFAEEPKGANLKKVFEEVGRAALTSNGRIEVDNTLRRRQLMKGIAEPLRLGEMHETVFLLSQHWKNHFVPKIEQAGGTATVRDLRNWINEPDEMGLPKPVENLIIVIFAIQTNRTFFEHGSPVKTEITYAKLEDGLELRTWQGPPQIDWDRSVELSSHLFGLTPSSLYNAANVARLTGEIKSQCEAVHRACQKLCDELADRSSKFGLPDDNTRLNTARVTLQAVQQIVDAPDSAVISTLAAIHVESSETAMGKSLQSAKNLVESIHATSWGAFEDIEKLPDEYQQQAAAIRQSVIDALKTDEYTIGLAEAIRTAQNDAVNLITTAAISRPQPEPGDSHELTIEMPDLPDPPKVSLVVSLDSRTDLTQSEAAATLDAIRTEVSSNEKRRLSISWKVTEVEE